jgi:hypothetical protein
MRHTWIWLCVSGLILAGVAGCGPAVFSTPSDVNATPYTQAPTIQAVAPTATMEPTSTSGNKPPRPGSGMQMGTVIPISPTQTIMEKKPVSGTPLTVPSESTENVRLAKEDLAGRLRVSVDEITVVAVIGGEFSTDAFYCRASKGRIAKDASPEVISGVTILLSASGGRYEYHASDQTVVFCRPLS